MPAIVIRRARPEDVPALVPLYYEIHAHHIPWFAEQLIDAGRPGGWDGAAIADRLRKVLSGQLGAIFAAEASGELVGVVDVYMYRTEGEPGFAPRLFGYVDTLVVTLAWRGHGIAGQLMAAAEGWAIERGATEMELMVWEYPDSALGLYERLGYQTRKRVMIKQL